MPTFIRTGEKAGALNLWAEFKRPIFNADSEIKNKKGDILLSKLAESSFVASSKPKAKILISSVEK